MHIEIGVLVTIVILWVLGGQWKGRIRDIGVPVVLGLALIYFLPGDLLHKIIFGLLTGGLANTIRIGYGNYSPEDDPKPSFLAKITHDRNGWYIRAIWGLIVATSIGLGLFLGHFIGIWVYLGYIGINIIINFLVSRLRFPVLLADICVASDVGIILFLIGG